MKQVGSFIANVRVMILGGGREIWHGIVVNEMIYIFLVRKNGRI